MNRLVLARVIVAISVVIVFVFLFASFAFGSDATAGCTTVRLDAGRDGPLGVTTLIYADGTKDRLDIANGVFQVDNRGVHGPIIRVRFSNGESVELAAPVGCTSPVTGEVSPAALPRTGIPSSVYLTVGVAALVLSVGGLCVVGNSRLIERRAHHVGL